MTSTNGRFPRSKILREALLRASIRRGAANPRQRYHLAGIEIDPGAIIGAVVTRIVRCPDRNHSPATGMGVGAPEVHQLRFAEDMRGSVSVGEYDCDIPFVPKCCFRIF